ncbi:two-component system response regulator [Pelomonas sp. UHG3]|uniref:Two-component system response regulator n=1 Tax=Roseateles hydrophilus TaxID=2975054 RepID=A0ACC6C7K7_9BURK|nr:two-component system response regulator [Pelomonas sp. UHG3]MCY4744406.1 two-component system response regulator [Pelomonas sp. UHG3]
MTQQDAPTPPAQPTVLVVDDTPANLTLLAQVLKPDYRVLLAVNGAKALEICRRQAPDLIVLDIMMPGMDGYEVCRQLKADPATRRVPVIFLTALTRPEDETAGFDAGGADFIHKPFNPATALARVRTHVQLKLAEDHLLRHNHQLSGELDARRREVERLRDTTLFVMVGLAEFRDADTGNHIQRTQEYVRTLARWIADQPGAPAELTDEAIDELAKAAPLHDIGKVAIPDGILLKPGKLSADEWRVMKTHAEQGADLLQRAIDRLGDDAGLMLTFGKQIARHHHEKWDGSGYPDGLAGDTIPLAARLMAVADVYDALISVRPYKRPMSHDEALTFIRDGSGSHFDPRVVQALDACEDAVKAIAARWAD